jgi:hypothetical protein
MSGPDATDMKSALRDVTGKIHQELLLSGRPLSEAASGFGSSIAGIGSVRASFALTFPAVLQQRGLV